MYIFGQTVNCNICQKRLKAGNITKKKNKNYCRLPLNSCRWWISSKNGTYSIRFNCLSLILSLSAVNGSRTGIPSSLSPFCSEDFNFSRNFSNCV
ncbi:hypothetical protein PUN28_008201 [Cardiocondyla obscurior]|uniref:Uncharacterized protein n=1 Tax=Cardiocondyla obscurior TaxID=286306 RepID=A0AAW2FZR2_9HYME